MKKAIRFLISILFKHKHGWRFDASIGFEECDEYYAIYTERYKCGCGKTKIVKTRAFI